MALSNYLMTRIVRMARSTGTELTDRHLQVLEFAHRHWEAHQVGPLYLSLKRHLGLERTELGALFPHGLASVYTWVGIPIQTPHETCRPPAQLEVKDRREVYLDHNATTPIREEVARVLHDYHEGGLGFGNPSSGTRPGQEAFDRVQEARRTLADCLDARPDDVVFTSCGSESNNTVVRGLGLDALLAGRRPHLVCSAVEHPSVLEPHRWLERHGARVAWVAPGVDGRVAPEAVEAALVPDTVLVSVMAANNEIGTLQPIEALGDLCRRRRVPLLVDAVQALGAVPLRPRAWGVSYMSFSAHKLGGPKGVGALYRAPDAPLPPLLLGGGQEAGRRAGTENVGYVHAMATAVRLAVAGMEADQARLRALRDRFLEGLRRVEPGLRVNGSLEHRLAGNLSVAFPAVDTSALLLSLDHIGVYASAGSACSSGRLKTSHVLQAIGADTERFGTIRFGLGRGTRPEDVDYVLEHLPEILRQIRDPAPG